VTGFTLGHSSPSLLLSFPSICHLYPFFPPTLFHLGTLAGLHSSWLHPSMTISYWTWPRNRSPYPRLNTAKA